MQLCARHFASLSLRFAVICAVRVIGHWWRKFVNFLCEGCHYALRASFMVIGGCVMILSLG